MKLDHFEPAHLSTKLKQQKLYQTSFPFGVEKTIILCETVASLSTMLVAS